MALRLARLVALRRLRLRPGRLALTVLSIAFGVASVVGVDLVGRAVRASLEKRRAAPPPLAAAQAATPSLEPRA